MRKNNIKKNLKFTRKAGRDTLMVRKYSFIELPNLGGLTVKSRGLQ